MTDVFITPEQANSRSEHLLRLDVVSPQYMCFVFDQQYRATLFDLRSFSRLLWETLKKSLLPFEMS